MDGVEREVCAGGARDGGTSAMATVLHFHELLRKLINVRRVTSVEAQPENYS